MGRNRKNITIYQRCLLSSYSKSKILLSLSCFLSEPSEKKLEECINPIAVHNRGCTANSTCYLQERVRYTTHAKHNIAIVSARSLFNNYILLNRG